jgi:hypothetical protein
MATIGLGFQLSASATQMAAGINAGVVELQKLGYAAKKTSDDVSTLKTIELSRVFIDSVRAASSALFAFVEGPAKAATALVDLSRRTGASASALQSYQFAAEQSGVGIESFAKAIQQLTINLGKASGGDKETVAAFRNIGLAINDLAGLTPEQQFEKIANAIAMLPTPAQQATAAIDLFGKTGRNLLSVFQEGPGYLTRMAEEARKVGVVLKESQLNELKELESSLGTVQAAFKALGARVAAELAPQLRDASKVVIDFISSIDSAKIQGASETAAGALRQLASVFKLVGTAALPLAGNILPSIGAYLAFINRQVISAGIANLARFFAAATASAFGYSAAAGTATAATAALGVSIRATLASTGIGVLVVGLGLLAGAALEWAVASKQAGADVTISIEDPQKSVKKYSEQLRAATTDTEEFGKRAKDALKIPDVNVTDFAQNSLSQAESAIKQLAQELGGLGQVPIEVLQQFDRLTVLAQQANAETIYQKYAIEQVDRAAKTFAQTLQNQADARKRDADAAKAASDAASKAAQESRQRVADLANAGVTDAEKSRLQLNKDLLAITTEQRDAEQARGKAMREWDLKSLAAANERLRLASEATKQAKLQNRERQLQALGIDANLLKPATGIADQFKAVREAFDRKLIDGGEARNALRNLAAEGISIRKDIAAELSRPASMALNANDIRTTEGNSLVRSLASGREDPAIAQRREQLAKLEEIRKAIAATGANPVEILGG